MIGRGNDYLPYFIQALQRAATEGLGRNRESMKLIDVWQANPVETESWVRIYRPEERLEPFAASVPVVPSVPPAMRMRMKTPVRLQREERLVTPDLFRFSDLFGALLRRVSMLSYFHSDSALETDFATLMEQARRVELTEKKLVWREWTRYSSRQKTAMQMGGLVGEVALELEADSPFWPYLWIGQWIHVGKGTSMGLGHYTIEAASLPNYRAR
ncbi:MAG TPA: CRISPR system precrRNA processing endoribonuclease RAMP protein Cas6 [Terriglobia bacterium]|nr:CRISPR system precrRNA processing endoribonuclease RAMP protein Cas6 [Terriglobia bacterium]